MILIIKYFLVKLSLSFAITYRYVFISVVYITQKNIHEYFYTNTTFIINCLWRFLKKKKKEKCEEKKILKAMAHFFLFCFPVCLLFCVNMIGPRRLAGRLTNKPSDLPNILRYELLGYKL